MYYVWYYTLFFSAASKFAEEKKFYLSVQEIPVRPTTHFKNRGEI